MTNASNTFPPQTSNTPSLFPTFLFQGETETVGGIPSPQQLAYTSTHCLLVSFQKWNSCLWSRSYLSTGVPCFSGTSFQQFCPLVHTAPSFFSQLDQSISIVPSCYFSYLKWENVGPPFFLPPVTPFFLPLLDNVWKNCLCSVCSIPLLLDTMISFYPLEQFLPENYSLSRRFLHCWSIWASF